MLETKSQISLNDVISINLNPLWFGLSACFGSSGDLCYIAYRTNETGSKTNIAKCKLGLGNNDLSTNGYGTFISGKDQYNFNGTLKVIETYEPIHLNVLQGMEYYKGKLWIMTSEDKVRAYQLQLLKNGTVKIENCFGFDQLDNSGVNIVYESEGMMHIDRDKLLVSIFRNSTPRTIILEI